MFFVHHHFIVFLSFAAKFSSLLIDEVLSVEEFSTKKSNFARRFFSNLNKRFSSRFHSGHPFFVIWLYAKTTNKIPASVQKLLDKNDLLISAAVEFEIELLYEIGRIKVPANVIIQDLHAHIGIKVSDVIFSRVIEVAKTIKWTRDPFDRMIVANASIFQLPLITKDKTILENYSLAKWGS